MFLDKKMFFAFTLITTMLFSQEVDVKKLDSIKTNELDEVVVTATRTKRQLSSVPMPVTLISKKQLKQSGSVRLRDILLEQTGVVMVSDVGNSEGIQLQGVAADYTLIMIDGVPIVGRTSGNIDLRRLTVNNIKQIEIVKGPSSSLYGSEAIGGVINIITEQPKSDSLKGAVSYFIKDGATNELDINTNIQLKNKRFGLLSGINLNSSNGFDLSPETISKTTEAHQNFTGDLKLSYDFSEQLKVVVANRFYEQNQKVNSEENKQSDWNVNAKIVHEISDNWSLDYELYATKYKAESVFNNDAVVYEKSLMRPEVKSTNKFNKGTLILGVGANFDALERTEFKGIKKYDTPYVFGQFDFNPIHNLNVIIGARFEKSNQYKSAFTPKISSSYKINNWLVAKSSVGYGFKAPDFRQLYFNFRNSASGYVVLGTEIVYDLYGNLPEIQSIEKELKPETSIGYNFGFQIKPVRGLKLNINLFRNDIKDLIDTFDTQLKSSDLELPSGTRVFSYKNINKVYTQGFELDANYKITSNFNILAGYQFLDTGDKTQENLIKSEKVFFRRTPSFPSEKMTISNYYGLPNRSKHMANFKVFYENYKHNFSANIRAVYRSKYALFDTNNSQGIIDEFDDFVVANTQINIAVSKIFFDLMNLQIGVNNLFNEKGEENKKMFNNNDSVLRLGTTLYSRVQFNF
ncbi:TonB-dependent receptor plug domain-containing protein [Tenacibaculum ovolyticum]|uniref:TonB-dependent receptor plug domain-containing protein n=1 Tax=Tenacibaculum ovolyticum TaxID=104270 RepID=UPI003BAC8429